MLCQKLAQPKEEKHNLTGPGRPAALLLSSLFYRAGIMVGDNDPSGLWDRALHGSW